MIYVLFAYAVGNFWHTAFEAFILIFYRDRCNRLWCPLARLFPLNAINYVMTLMDESQAGAILTGGLSVLVHRYAVSHVIVVLLSLPPLVNCKCAMDD